MTETTSTSARQPNGAGVFFFCGLLIGSLVVGFVLASRSAKEATPEDIAILNAVPPSVKPIHPLNVPGLQNVFRLGDNLISGSSPDDETAFGTLASLGIKAIISVDGGTPNIELARSHGIRYVHLPITYGSVPHKTVVQLVRTARSSQMPIYVHCHHGMHRGPAAAVALWRCLDRKISVEQAVATLKSLGTSDRFVGLYTSVKEVVPPSAAELQAAEDKLPEIAPVPPLAKTMAEIDRMWDRVIADEVDPTAVSMQMTIAFDLAEHFREAARLAETTDEMRPSLGEIADSVDQFAELIKAGVRGAAASTEARRKLSSQIKAQCTECHNRFRD